MRSKNAFKNLIFYLIYEVFLFALGIIFPRFIISTYGSEINGLTSTITRILSLINLLQAGAVGTAIYQMYKPVADGDYETQSAILYSSKKFYEKVTLIYLTIAIGAGFFYGFYLKSEILHWWEILLSFVILGTNGASYLLINSICDIFLSAHQKRYCLSISQMVNLFIHYGLLVIILLLKLHFIFIYFAILIGSIANASLNWLFFKRYSKGNITKNPINKKYQIPDRKYLMIQSIGVEAIASAPTIIITTTMGLTYSSVFSVYYMIFTSMRTILNAIPLSFVAIFGNLTKTSDNEKIHQVYDVIELLTMLLGTVAAVCVGFLIMPFIRVYTMGIEDVNYIYPVLGIFIAAYVAIFTFKASFSYVATVYGLFKKTCYISLISAIAGIIISIICVLIFGMPYVMIGLLLNEFGSAVAILFVLKRDISWFKTNMLCVRCGFLLMLTSLFTFGFYVYKPEMNSILEWVVYALIVAAVVIAILLIYSLVFERKQIKILLGYLKFLFQRKTSS